MKETDPYAQKGGDDPCTLSRWCCWAGFSGHDPNVLDGSSFRLEAVLADGTRIEAHGENKFPPNYRDVMSALDALTAAAQKNALQQYNP